MRRRARRSTQPLGCIVKLFLTFAAVALTTAGPATSVADSGVCDQFRRLGWPTHANLHKRALTPSLYRGAKEDGFDRFFNVDLNNDDIEDEMALGCSHSSMPADPCMLAVKLSTGRSYTFEAWKMFLVRFGHGVFAVTSDFEGSKDPKPNKIYRLGESAASLVCEEPR
jgi:hypothetical protein